MQKLCRYQPTANGRQPLAVGFWLLKSPFLIQKKSSTLSFSTKEHAR